MNKVHQICKCTHIYTILGFLPWQKEGRCNTNSSGKGHDVRHNKITGHKDDGDQERHHRLQREYIPSVTGIKKSITVNDRPEAAAVGQLV